MKGFDFKKVTDQLTDKNAYIALGAAVLYQIFVASKIEHKYLSNISVALVPGIAAGFLSKDKGLADKAAMAGLTLGGVAIIKDIVAELAATTTDPAKKAQYTTILAGLNGKQVQTVAGVDRSGSVNLREGVTYIPPQQKKDHVNRAALASGAGAY